MTQEEIIQAQRDGQTIINGQGYLVIASFDPSKKIGQVVNLYGAGAVDTSHSFGKATVIGTATAAEYEDQFTFLDYVGDASNVPYFYRMIAE